MLTLDDWLIDSSGHLDDASRGDLIAAAHEGRLGNWLTLNGSAKPRFHAAADRWVRVRLINAANARIMSIVLRGADAWLGGLDGHPVAPLRLAGHPVEIAPGQRADLILPRSQEEITIINEMGGEPLRSARSSAPAAPTAMPKARRRRWAGSPPPPSPRTSSGQRSGSRAVPAAVFREPAMAGDA